MAGCSPRGTAKKLGVKPGMAVVVVDAPAGWTIPDLPPDARVVRRSPAASEAMPAPALMVAFFRSAAALDASLADLARAIWPATALWAAWPRRAGGHASDLTDNVVREAALAIGLVDNKVAAVDDDWSGLRFVWRKEHRRVPPPA